MKKSTIFSAIALVVIACVIAYAVYSVNYVNQMTNSGPCNKPGVDSAVNVFSEINTEYLGLINQNTADTKNGEKVDYPALVAKFENEEKYLEQVPVPACMNEWKALELKSFHETTLAFDAYNHGSVTKFSEHLDESAAYSKQASDELNRILSCYPYCK